MQKRWNILETPPQSFFDEFPELHTTVATLLYHRHVRTQEKIDEFLQPDYSQDVHDPFLFEDMEKTVRRLFLAIENDEHITIHGDYDADGVSASVILTDTLFALGAKHVDVYLPHRETDGYGLNVNTINHLAEKGTNIIITCDCGISNKKEIAVANEKNIDVIVTDHHSIPDELPDAFAIIHPKVEREKYPYKDLAGGGVAFKLAQALLRTHHKTHETLPDGQSHEAFEKWLLDMVAVASVADMVPLIGESRTLTKYGLIVLNRAKRVGMKKLLIEAKMMHEDGSLVSDIDAHLIGFRIAPRINAAGRLDHANTAYALMATKSPTEAVDLAWQLDQSNQERRTITEEYIEQAIKQVEKNQKDQPVLFVFGEHWSTGIVGLVASRLKSTYHKPTIAMGTKQGEITGSGRSIKGFNLIEGLQHMPQFFTKFGGHPMACGFSLKDPEVLEEFKATLRSYFFEKTKDIDLTPTIDIDATLSLNQVNWDLYDMLQKFAPFGQGNPKPLYTAKGVQVVDVKAIGKQQNHIKMAVRDPESGTVRKCIGWQFCPQESTGTNWATALSKGSAIDIVFEINVNEWNGNRELQLQLIDIRHAA